MVNKPDVSKGEKDKPFLLYREERCILELSYYVLPLVFFIRSSHSDLYSKRYCFRFFLYSWADITSFFSLRLYIFSPIACSVLGLDSKVCFRNFSLIKKMLNKKGKPCFLYDKTEIICKPIVANWQNILLAYRIALSE